MLQHEEILRGNVVLSDGIASDACIVVRDGKIHDVSKRSSIVPTLDFTGQFLAPGYVDLHIHGIQGADTMHGTPDAIRTMATAVLRHGVTSFLPTTATQSIDATETAIRAVGEVMRDTFTPDRAHVLGVHLEGPWLSLQAKGAQNGDFIVDPEKETVLRLLDTVSDIVRIVTIAPELAGSDWAMGEFQRRGIAVSIGHTTATYEQADAVMTRGVRRVTHCFNQMTGLHHRKPGVVGAALLRDDVATELIADGRHIHPAVMKLLVRVKGASRVMLVTDSMEATDGPEGDEYDLAGQRVIVKDGEARLLDGSLAGSVLTMDKAVQNMVGMCGVAIPEAIAMASATPADSIGLSHRKGRIEPGLDADLIVLDQNLVPIRQFVADRS